MWTLTNEDSNHIASIEIQSLPKKVHYLICGPPLNVVRDGNGHIIIKDRAISKLHAKFVLHHHEKHLKDPGKLPEVILTDLKSSNGTYLNDGIRENKRLTTHEGTPLKHQDLIRFGSRSFWRLCYNPLVVTSSQIPNVTKVELKENMLRLGGHLSKEWMDECSLLVMNSLMLTVKTVLALVNGAHIVTPAYLSNMVSSIVEQKELPEPENYLSPLKEPSICSSDVSFSPNPSRRELFSGKVFLFQNDVAYKRMSCIIAAAGGSSLLLTENNFKEVLNKNSILIKSERESASQSDTFCDAHELLKKKQLHAVPESDIGLAVVYNSTEKYCNPKFKINDILRPNGNEPQQLAQSLEIYAAETQQFETEACSFPTPSRTTIIESGESTKDKPVSLSDTKQHNGCTSPSKKQQKPSTSSDSLSRQSLSNGNRVVHAFANEDKENYRKRKRLDSDKSFPNMKAPKSHKTAENTSEEPEIICLDVVDNASFNPMFSSTERQLTGKKRDSTKDATITDPVSYIMTGGRKSTRRVICVSPDSKIERLSPSHGAVVAPNHNNQMDCDGELNSEVATKSKIKSMGDEDPYSTSSKTSKVAQHTKPPTQLASVSPQSNDLGINKSIPFELCTLPSIPAEDMTGVEDMDEDFFREVVEETPSNEDQKRELNHPQKAEQEPIRKSTSSPPANDDDDDDWICSAKIKIIKRRESDPTCNSQSNQTLYNPADTTIVGRQPPPPPVNDKLQLKEDNDFALPFISQTRRRGRNKSSEVDETVPNSKRIKKETEVRLAAVANVDTTHCGQEPAVLPIKKEVLPISPWSGEKEVFISKKSETVKMERESSCLGNPLDSSLIVVEVVSLVVKVQLHPDVVAQAGPLKNFKKFRKVRHSNDNEEEISLHELSTALPRIIGEGDLVVSTRANESVESFISSQVGLREELERMENQNTANDGFDSDFKLIASSRNRRRGRVS